MSDIKDQVQHIVNTIENPPMLCQDCGNQFDDGDLISCPDCDSSEINMMSGFDYLNDVLDIEWTLGSDKKTLLGARVLVCFGGPNVWIDTRHNRVEGHWWQDSYNEAFVDNTGLDDALQELWECQ